MTTEDFLKEVEWKKEEEEWASDPADGQEAEFWRQIGWARITDPSDQNTDLLPNSYSGLDAGCPKCGSAWAALLAVGFDVKTVDVGKNPKRLGGLWIVEEFLTSPRICRAVRVECCAGHVAELDGRTKKVRVIETRVEWLSMVVAASAVMAGYLAAYAWSGPLTDGGGAK